MCQPGIPRRGPDGQPGSFATFAIQMVAAVFGVRPPGAGRGTEEGASRAFQPGAVSSGLVVEENYFQIDGTTGVIRGIPVYLFPSQRGWLQV